MSWNMIGHEWAVDMLQKHVAQNRTRHAYLFTGPEGVGRRTLAIRLAQALNCPQSQAPGVPCQVCRVCQRIGAMRHPDLSLVEAEFIGSTLKVEQVRDLQHSLALAPYEAAYRIALLQRFEEATEGAQNALLKTLEEPNPQVILLITAESSERILPTIVSRCEVIRLRPAPLEQVETGLIEHWQVEPETAKLLAHLSGGRPGYALQLFQQPELREQRKMLLEEHTRLLKASRLERFQYADAITKDRALLFQALSVWISFWRDVMITCSQAAAPITNLDRFTEIKQLCQVLDLDTAHATLKSLAQAMLRLNQNVNARMTIEVLMLDLPRL